MNGVLDIYRYIKFCLYGTQGVSLKRMKLQKDIQHDIFVLVVGDKGKTELTPNVKRYIYLVAKFHWNGISKNKYSRAASEIVQLDEDGLQIEHGVSNEINADIAMDIETFTKKKKTNPNNVNGTPILVRYLNNKVKTYSSIKSFIEDIGCSEFTAYKWLRDGKPAIKVGSKKNKDKYGHIKSIEYKMTQNPFQVSKTKIKKLLSEKSWNKRKDHAEFEMEDENEHHKLFVHLESKEGWLVKLETPIGSEFYIKRLVDSKK